MRELVVGVDGSAGSSTALAWAVEEARAHHATLTVVTVVQPPLLLFGAFDMGADYGPHVDRMAERRAADLLERMIAAFEAVDVPLEPVVLRDGTTYRALVDRARGTDALVVGARGDDGLRHLLLGSVSQQVVVHASSAVVVVPAPDAGHGRRDVVVVGYDGSDGAHRAVLRGAEEAQVHGCELQLVVVQPPPPVSGERSPAHAAFDAVMWGGTESPQSMTTPDVERRRAQLLASWRHRAQGMVDDEAGRIDAELRPDKVTTSVVAHRSPARALLDASEWARLLVVGSRGHGGFTGMLLGSVSQHCVRHAVTPTLVVPPA